MDVYVYTYTHTHMHIDVYMHTCMYVCMYTYVFLVLFNNDVHVFCFIFNIIKITIIQTFLKYKNVQCYKLKEMTIRKLLKFES